MRRGLTGEYRNISTVGEVSRAFIPAPLPPHPPLQIDSKLRAEMDQALLWLGRLDSVTTLLPETSIFLYAYIRKEAVVSSQIEGTQSSLSDLLLFEAEEAPGVPLDDVQEVSNYVAAMDHGLRRIKEGFPISLRLFKEIHEVLLSKGRGHEKDPGEFRRSQNWIGGSRPGNAAHVPPPPGMLMDCMGALEKFLHDDPEPTPLLIKAALAHVQFETIHPFLDGNGRLGRLLITLLLCAEGVLSEPLLYLSLYFKTRRQQYYDFLQKVRLDGDWESWIEFFVIGVRETAESAVQTARRLVDMIDRDRRLIQTLGKAAGSTLRVHEALARHPLLTPHRAAAATGLSQPTITNALNHLIKLGLVREVTGRQWNRMYGYEGYLNILSEGTEPIR